MLKVAFTFLSVSSAFSTFELQLAGVYMEASQLAWYG